MSQKARFPIHTVTYNILEKGREKERERERKREREC